MNKHQNLLKKNMIPILGLIGITIILIAVSFLTDSSRQLEEKDLNQSGESSIQKLVINEIMSSNGGAYASSTGKICDWIELYNGNNHDMNLKNYGLSDRTNTVKWVFPDTTIQSHGYLIINLCGTKEEGLYTDFKLSSSGGETIALKNESGKVVDAVESVSLKKNQVMVRDLNGTWITSMMPTPGYPNTKEGQEQYVTSLKGAETLLKITEFLPKNAGNFSLDGEFYGYIELTNTGTESISLKDYQLSGDSKYPFMWELPDQVLRPNEQIVIYTSGKNRIDDRLEANFKLESKIGSVVLSYQGKTAQIVDYENIPNGMAYVLVNNGFEISNAISPGYPNTVEGVNKFSEQFLKNPEDLLINEVMNQNSKYLLQNSGEAYDWVELKNNTNHSLSLKDYALTTDNDLFQIFPLPDITLEAGKTVVIMASGNKELSNQTYTHADFKLSEAESLYLLKGKKVVDSMVIANLNLDQSMGRGNQNGFFYFDQPTPNAENKEGVREIAFRPKFSQKSGVYNDVTGINLDLTSNGTIYYTLDGSTPTSSSKQYNGSLFLDRTTVIKAISVENGKKTSEVMTSSYIINENHTLPVISVSLNPNELSKLNSNSWGEYETPAYVEFYEKEGEFQIPGEVKLFGGSARGFPKKSYQLKFRTRYGESKLIYPMFDTRDNSVYHNLVLRSGSQDYENAFIRDILGTSLADVTAVDTQAYKSTILYLNGTYYGIYNIREKVDDHFISEHYNVDGKKADLLRIDGEVKVGSNKNYQSLLQYVNNHDLSKDESYQYVKQRVDLDSFIDFWVAELYVTNNDIVNCRFFSHPNIDEGKWHYIFYDLDWAFYNYSYNYYNFILDPSGMATDRTDLAATSFENVLLRNLMKNKDFQKQFLEHLSDQMKNVWKKERVLEKIDELYQMLLPEMPRNQERWGLSMSTWNQKITELKNYVEKREGYLLSHTKSFFRLSDVEMKQYFGDSNA